MSVSLFIARRLSLSSGGKKSSPAVKVAVAAVALSVMVMMCAIAIVFGFKEEITERVAGFNSHMSVYVHQQPRDVDSEIAGNSANDASGNILTLTPSLKQILNASPFLEDYSLQASIPAILKTQDDFKGIYLKSLSGRETSHFIASSVVEGKVPDYSQDSCRNSIVISSGAAGRLGLKAGDRIDTYFISDQVRVRPLRVAAIYNSHFEAFDDTFGYGALSLIQDLGQLSPNQGTSIALSVNDFSKVDDYHNELQQRLIDGYSNGEIYRLYRVETALQSGAAYFQWLNLLDINVMVVLTLMTIVACVTLVSGMLILMVDKIRFIALMSALGAPRRQISRVFMLLAARIALYGLAIGNILAIALLYAQQHWRLLPLDPDSYYIDFVPVRFSLPAILMLNAGIMIVIWMVLLLPSRFAGKAAPARTLAAE